MPIDLKEKHMIEEMSQIIKDEKNGFLEKYLNRDTAFITVIIILAGFFLVPQIWSKNPYKAGTQYFVYLFPDINSSLNYRLPADILIEEDCTGGECEHDIQIETVYLENGSSKYFGCIVQLKYENFCKDQDGKEWMIVLSDWEEAKTIKEIKDSKKKVDDIVNSVMSEDH